MAMSRCATRQAVRRSCARPALRGRGARLAVRPSAARKRTSAPQRSRWTWPWEQQPEAPAPAVDPAMLLTILVSIFTTVGLQKVFIDDSSTVLTLKLDGAIKDLTSKLESTNTKLDTISKDVAANNNKLDTLNDKLQAQQVQVADLKGQVGVLRDVFTGTTTPTPTEKK